jgi:hypothetical protein
LRRRYPPFWRHDMLRWKVRMVGVLATLTSLAAIAGAGKFW